MKVHELISALKKLDQDTLILYVDANRAVIDDDDIYNDMDVVAIRKVINSDTDEYYLIL